MQGGGGGVVEEENREHCGRTIYTSLEEGGERGCMYYQA